ncbi:multidrug efflux SMR transporter [Sporosarcina sp. Marseille-Q4063]|uniref:DMT family transporter n=1 Tax=Sporosarcina sp. Marseille-Q4063 TaxID=2810514 RepID=UPI001BAEEC0C|nr:multidrug efflux SMR transporter [Sporosarcina sp. Marseille-Q4063]QUW23664.1 multidrug efflux SMR transporter [Sporosarcina sp. Marseille-Q4063]
MAWLYVLFAAFVEVFWVIGLRYSSSFLEWAGTTIMIVFSFYFIIKACEKLPSGTVYAVFTGSGAAAIVLIDFIVFDAAFSLMKVLFIGLIIVGVVGIKMTDSGEKESQVDLTS